MEPAVGVSSTTRTVARWVGTKFGPHFSHSKSKLKKCGVRNAIYGLRFPPKLYVCNSACTYCTVGNTALISYITVHGSKK